MKNKKILGMIIFIVVVVIGITLFWSLNAQKTIEGRYKTINSDLLSTSIEFMPDSKNAKEGTYKSYMETKNGQNDGVEGRYKQENGKIIFENNEEKGVFGNARPKTLLDMAGEELSIRDNYLIDKEKFYDGKVPETETFNAIISSDDTKYEFKDNGTLIIDDEEETVYERNGDIITYKHLLNDGVSEQTMNLYVFDGKVINGNVYRKEEE